MSAVTTPAPSLTPRPSRWRRSRDTRSAYMYLLPAFLVMGLITFYPLLFQTYMSFTDFGLRNLAADGARADLGRPRQLRPDPRQQLGIPNFHFLRMLVFNLWWAFSNVVIHVVIGVAIAVLLNTPRAEVRALLPGAVHPARHHPADHRRDGLAQHVRRAERRDQPDPGGPSACIFRIPPITLATRLAAPNRSPGPDPVHPAAARLLRAAGREHLAGLAAELGRRDRRAPEHPERAVRGRRDGRRGALAEVPDGHAALPSAGDAAVRDLRLRHHVQPVLPVVLHVRRRTVRAGRSCS